MDIARSGSNSCATPAGTGSSPLIAEARSAPPADDLAERRRMVADLCRFLGAQLTGEKVGAGTREPPRPARAELAEIVAGLAPRVRQTLDRLLAGDSEKQIAGKLGVSPHTVHVYAKTLHR